ncbi:MAG: hypothetical protein KIS96_06965 [Bauldia sp.]|nr:hypothetical protein [Bauldia sp.]
MRRAVIAHLFYPELALDLLDRIAGLDPAIDVIASGRAMQQEAVAAALGRLPHRVVRLATADRGFDVGPFLDALRLVHEGGYELFAKLHTKRGDPAYGRRWRDALLDATIGPGMVDLVTARFAADPDLAIIGARPLFLSVRRNMLANAGTVAALAAICFPGRDLPADWGFFAGTMFWGRVAAFEPFLNLQRAGYVMPANLGLADGHPAHALERLFGLAGKAALVARDGRTGRGVIRPAPRRLPDATIMDVLPRLGRPDPDAPISGAEARLAAARNPLVDYLRGSAPEIDPNPFFNENRNRLLHGVARAALVPFLRQGANAEWQEPTFDLHDHVHRHPWLRRTGVNPLVDRILRMAADGATRPRDDVTAPDAPAFLVLTGADPDAASYWGDIPFAEGLAAALRRAGSRVAVAHRATASADVVIVLRGPVAFAPREDAFNILWIISHPDQVTPAELDGFDLVYVASSTAPALLRNATDTPVRPLLQATDADRFGPPRTLTDGREVLFVGNTRGEDRRVVRWAVEEGLEPAIYGFGWERLLPDRLLRGTQLDDRHVAARYAAAAAVLNDHWPAMAEFGIVNNRLFDTLASGGNPVSDAMPAVSRLLGGAVRLAAGRADIGRAVEAARQRTPEMRRSEAGKVRRDHSFDARARTILRDVDRLRSGRPLGPVPAHRGARTVVLLLPGGSNPPGDLVFSRLIAPLTREEAGPVNVVVAAPAEARRAADAVIVPTSAFGDAADAEAAVRWAADAGAPLIVDHAGPASPAADRLTAKADEAWFANPTLLAASSQPARGVVMPDAIEQRLWRDFHRRTVFDWSGGPVRILMLGTRRLPSLVEAVRASGLSGSVSVLAIGQRVDGADAPFVTIADKPPGDRAYPRFAHWLRATVRPHIAVALDREEADRAFLVHSALGAVSIIPDDPADPAILRDCLALVADETTLPEVLHSVVAEPLRFAPIAAAASRHIWSQRGTASLAAAMRRRLTALAG